MKLYFKVIIIALFFAAAVFLVSYVMSKNIGMSLIFALVSFVGNFIYEYVMKISERKAERRINDHDLNKEE